MEAPEDVLDVGNSGTTLYLSAGITALSDTWSVFTGDDQIRKRSAQSLLSSLQDLGADAISTRQNGCTPLMIRGPLKGGSTEISCPTSQYLSGLLLATPFARGDTEINVTLLNERPYVEITLGWLDSLGIAYRNDEFKRFYISGGQTISPFDRSIPADFSSATFFLCAAALTGADLTLEGLDMSDSQGDKAVVQMLAEMGAEVEIMPRAVRIRGGALKGRDIDLNATPDALPAMAITGCFAEGTTRLLNVPQARMKETDRIAVMREVITTLGGEAEELPDGLIVRGSGLRGGRAPGHGDHRVVMACAVAGLVADEFVEVTTAEAVGITFPNFVELMNATGARMTLADG